MGVGRRPFRDSSHTHNEQTARKRYNRTLIDRLIPRKKVSRDEERRRVEETTTTTTSHRKRWLDPAASGAEKSALTRHYEIQHCGARCSVTLHPSTSSAVNAGCGDGDEESPTEEKKKEGSGTLRADVQTYVLYHTTVRTNDALGRRFVARGNEPHSASFSVPFISLHLILGQSRR